MSSHADTLIRIADVSMRRDDRLILDGINLDVAQGDFIAVTGPNGGGKTTLLRILLKLIKPTSGSVRYYIDGVETTRLPIGYLPQKNMIDSHFPISVGDVIASGLMQRRDLSKADKTAMIDEVLSLVGMDDYSRRPIGRLSGGQLQRTLLARAIVSQPRVLVLDEPLSYLDKRFEHHFYDILESIAQNTTIVLVSHEMTGIARMANRHFIVDCTLSQCSTHHHYIEDDCECRLHDTKTMTTVKNLHK